MSGDLFAALVARVVEDQGDGHAGMSLAYLVEQCHDQRRAHRAIGAHADDLMAVALNGSEHTVALSSRRGLDEHPPKAPEHAQEGSHDEVGRVGEEDLALATLRRFKPGEHLLLVEVELQLRVALAGDGGSSRREPR